MFIAALFTIAKTWKQPKCPSTDEWIKKCVCVYIYICVCMCGISLSHKKEWNFAFCNNMDGLGRDYAKWNKSEMERQILYITYMWNLKNKTH